MPPEEDNFAAAFAQLTAEVSAPPADPPASDPATPPADPPATSPAPEPTPVPAEPTPSPAPAAEPPAPADPNAPPSGDPADPNAPPSGDPATPPAAPAPAPAEPSDDDVLARLAAAIKKTPEPAPAPASSPAAQPAPEAPPLLYTTEEEGVITNYQKEWPDVAKAEALIRRGEYNAVVSHMFTEIAKQIEPLRETLAAVAERAFLQDVTTQVSDYDQVRDQVAEWIKTQPTYLQVAYDHVANTGTVAEVTDLINRWRKETGTVITAPAATPPAPPPAKTELPPSTKQAVAALAPVSSKRSTAGSADDPNDFDGAFHSFATEKV